MAIASGSAVQYIATSVVMLIASASFESMRVQWSFALIGAVVWLVLALSLGAILLLF